MWGALSTTPTAAFCTAPCSCRIGARPGGRLQPTTSSKRSSLPRAAARSLCSRATGQWKPRPRHSGLGCLGPFTCRVISPSRRCSARSVPKTPPVSSRPWVSGRGWTCLDRLSRSLSSTVYRSRVPTTRFSRQGGRRLGLWAFAWWICHERPPCSPRAPAGSSAPRQIGGSLRSLTGGSQLQATPATS